jgi:hypothetical protein
MTSKIPKDGKRYMFLSNDRASSDSSISWNGKSWDVYFKRAIFAEDQELFVGAFNDIDEAKHAVRKHFAEAIKLKLEHQWEPL